MKLWIAIHRSRFDAGIRHAPNPVASKSRESDLLHLEQACREGNGSGSIAIRAGFIPERRVARIKSDLKSMVQTEYVGEWFVGQIEITPDDCAQIIMNDDVPVMLRVSWRALWEVAPRER